MQIIDCLKTKLPNEIVYCILNYLPNLNIGTKELNLHKKKLLFLNILKYKLKVYEKTLFRSILENTNDDSQELSYYDDHLMLYINLNEGEKLSDVDFVCIYY